MITRVNDANFPWEVWFPHMIVDDYTTVDKWCREQFGLPFIYQPLYKNKAEDSHEFWVTVAHGWRFKLQVDAVLCEFTFGKI
jgi:hypothetical protein